MAVTSTSFGQSNGNRSGRRIGSKSRLTIDFHEAYEEAKARFKHPYLHMLELANDPSVTPERRDAFLKECASYVCPKPRQSISVQSEVPTFSTTEQAEEFLSEFIASVAPDLEPAEAAAMIKQWVDLKRAGAELQLKINPPEMLPQRIEIVNSPGPLRGTNISMPTLFNGQEHAELPRHINGEIVPESTTAPVPAATNSFTALTDQPTSDGANAPPETPGTPDGISSKR
jgi:hypothetical protein